MTRYLRRVLLALALVGITLPFSAVWHVQATTYIPGCDLAALITAIGDANTNGAPDTINLEAGCTYTVTSTLFVEADGGKTLTINGSGAIINGGNNTRVLIIQSGAVVSINNLIIQNGYATNTVKEGVGGGNVVNYGNLTLTGVTLRAGNANGGGAGIVNNGTLNMTGSRVAGNAANSGGGIFNVGTATILSSEITRNGATYGGGITNNGNLTIVNSTIAQNGADGGGAISVNGGSVMLVNVTIVANASFEGSALRQDYAGGTVVIKNSIIDNAPYGDCNLSSVTFTYSIMNSNDCGFPAGTGNIKADPQLSGFTSGYYPLLEGSPAIDAIPVANCIVTTDQRGYSRPSATGCDMGAFEFTAVLPATPTLQVSSAASAPPAVYPSTCPLLGYPANPAIRVVVPGNLGTTGNIPVIVCYSILTDPAQFGVTDRTITLAVEVVAYTQADGNSVSPLNQPIQICLQGTGSLLYRDATGQPRVVTTLSATSEAGFTCGTIPNAGTVILVPGAAAPVGSTADTTSHSLNMCEVTTNGILNLHSAPDQTSPVISLVPNVTKLSATARTAQWVHVTYANLSGWLAVRYLSLDGNCS